MKLIADASLRRIVVRVADDRERKRRLICGNAAERLDAEWKTLLLDEASGHEDVDAIASDERLILDFGSGTGRFTPALADLIGGKAIGVDPIQHLLDLSPRASNVEYRLPQSGRIPLPDSSVDVVWISLVLGAITAPADLRLAVDEIERVLKDDGLLFLVENTADKPDLKHFHFRTIAEYEAMFPSMPLRHESDYEDLGERISVFTGRKR